MLGEEFEIVDDDGTCRHLVREGFVELRDILSVFDWENTVRRELRADAEVFTPTWGRVVACLNIWNDLPSLEATLPTWFEHVDHVIAVDGAYQSTGVPIGASDDGTVEFLRSLGPKVTVIEGGMSPWTSQNEKRNTYFEHARPGDLLFVIDADEYVTHGERLRTVPMLDVGWVRVGSPLYKRVSGQPRLFAAAPGLRYKGRHHWIVRDDTLLATHQYGGGNVQHRDVPIHLYNERTLLRPVGRIAAKNLHSNVQFMQERALVQSGPSTMSDAGATARETLRIVQLAAYDAGMVPSRLHTGINATTPHTSAYFCEEKMHLFGGEPQYTAKDDTHRLRIAVEGCDIMHVHLTLRSLDEGQCVDLVKQRELPLVLHHHGSMFREDWELQNIAASFYHALVLVSNLELLSYNADAKYLPNPVPVARYRALRHSMLGAGTFITPDDLTARRRPLRIAHSPSKRAFKGTEQFLEACAALNAGGIAVEPVLIEKVSLGESLRIKATCDLMFDSFWLGMQCSGIEAAAMQMPVIAGDATVASRAKDLYGYVPYTFADNKEQLIDVIARFATDIDFFDVEARRVGVHVEQYHDDAVVALRYLDLLDERFNWRRKMQGI